MKKIISIAIIACIYSSNAMSSTSFEKLTDNAHKIPIGNIKYIVDVSTCSYNDHRNDSRCQFEFWIENEITREKMMEIGYYLKEISPPNPDIHVTYRLSCGKKKLGVPWGSSKYTYITKYSWKHTIGKIDYNFPVLTCEEAYK